MSNGGSIAVYGKRKHGHFDNHARVFCRLFGAARIDAPIRQLANMFRFKTIIFIDGAWHLIYAPLCFVRAILGQKNVFLVIRSRFVTNGTFWHRVKTALCQTLRRWGGSSFVSIDLRGHDEEMERYYDLFVDDIQLWDLPYLDLGRERPLELESGKPASPILFVPGGIDGSVGRKRPEELRSFLEGFQGPGTVIVAGRIVNFNCSGFLDSSFVIVIDRYVSDAELMYLYELSDVVHCYYSLSMKRPSGIFGRAVQLGKWTLVKKGGYLHRNYNYPRTVPISSLEELRSLDCYLDPEVQVSPDEIRRYDSSQELRQFVEAL